jgi:hypothetical protein
MRPHPPNKLEELLLRAIEGQLASVPEEERLTQWHALREHLDSLDREPRPPTGAPQAFFSRN